MNYKNIYSGQDSILNFLDPSQGSYIPLVELPEHLNPFLQRGIHIYAKLMYLLPLGNVKSIPAFSMLQEANKNGNLNNKINLVEASSGNTALSLTIIGKAMGINNTTSLVASEISSGKLNLLRLFGTDIEVFNEPICADPGDKESRIYKAKELGQHQEWFNADQYSNPNNPLGHYQITGPQIWDQLNGKVNIFASNLGTTGTILGTSKYLKERNPKVKTWAFARKPNNLVPGLRTVKLLKDISHNWQEYVDLVGTVGTVESYTKSLQLIRSGIIAGPSSGFTLQGILNQLKIYEEQNLISELTNDNEINIVFICCDAPYPYLNDYFKYLPESFFPVVKNKEYLENEIITQDLNPDIKEIDVQSAFKNIYPYNSTLDLLNKSKVLNEVQLKPGVSIIDVRTSKEFEEHHLFGSINIPLDILSTSKDIVESFRGQKVYLICKSGQRSYMAANIFNSNGINAINIQGGFTEWSLHNLPRWDYDKCNIYKAT